MPRHGDNQSDADRAGRSCATARSWRRIITNDPDELMPPPDSHLVLTPTAEGDDPAVDRAGRGVSAALGVPAREAAGGAAGRRDAGWVRNEIDAFVLARLEAEGLAAAREADRRSLIRRVTLDLTGLPPTLERGRSVRRRHVAGCVREASSIGCSPARVTASGWRWTGSTRPATPTRTGSTTTASARMWRWRDWVIDAFNANKPYDAFITEQLAGDLLPERDARSEDRVGVQPQSRDEQRRRDHRRGVPRRVRRRPHVDGRHGVAGADAAVRPLPRSQVRPAHAEGVLPALRVLQSAPGKGPDPAPRATPSRC